MKDEKYRKIEIYKKIGTKKKKKKMQTRKKDKKILKRKRNSNSSDNLQQHSDSTIELNLQDYDCGTSVNTINGNDYNNSNSANDFQIDDTTIINAASRSNNNGIVIDGKEEEKVGQLLNESTKEVIWNNINGKKKKITFQHGIYTIPHIDDPNLQEYFDCIVKLLGKKLECFTISKEKHNSSDHYHIHCYLKYIKRATISPTSFDKTLGKHGNLRIVTRGNVKRNQCNILKYVTKYGNFMDYPVDWDSQVFIREMEKKKKELKTNTIALGIMEGKYKSKMDVARDGYAGAAMIYSKHIGEFINACESEREYSRKKEIVWEKLKATMEWGKEWYTIITWLNFYVRNAENNVGKIKHLYICGAKNLGKTTRLLNPLRKRLNIYDISKDKVQNLYWTNNFYDLCIMDDYDGDKPITWMNEFLGSETTNVRVPGGGHDKKTEIVPTIIISNITLEECYKTHIELHGKDERYLALEDRFIVVNLKSRGNPFGIDDEDAKILKNLMYQLDHPEEFCKN
jgi:hypothetical protein